MTKTKEAMLGGLVGLCGAMAIVFASVVSTVSHNMASMTHHSAPAKAQVGKPIVVASR